MTKVTVKWLDMVAVTDGISWSSDDKDFETLLEASASREIIRRRSIYVYDYAIMMAEYAVRILSGVQITSIDERSKREPGKVY